VAKVIGSKITQTAQYFQMSGSGYYNSEGDNSNQDEMLQYLEDTSDTTDPIVGTPVTTPVKSASFWDNLNLSDLLGKGVDLFKTYTKGQSDAEIAKQHALVEQAKADAIKAGNETYIDPTTGQKINVKTDTGMSTSTIVIISVVGVALLGTIIYFVARPKK
jgi:hypothetical protein